MAHSSTTFCQGEHEVILNRSMLPFQYVDRLGVGMSAVVDKVEHKTNGQIFAHKAFLQYFGPEPEKYKQAFQNEIDIIKRLRYHPHIIQVYWSYDCGNEFGMLLTPVASEGDLRAYLRAIQETGKAPTPEQQSVLYHSFGCLASGLAFIHSHTIRHKDIKPQNILVHNGQMIYTDFGIALNAAPGNTTTTGRPEAFTRRYCAPEVANWEKRNRKSDVFSLGCVFIEILAVLEPDIDLKASNLQPYWQTVDQIQGALLQFSASDSGRDQLFRACHTMLEPISTDRVGAEALLYRLQSIQSCHPDPGYKLFCDNCAPDNTAEITTSATVRELEICRKDGQSMEGRASEEIEQPEINIAFSPFQIAAFRSIPAQAAIQSVMEMPLKTIELRAMHIFIVWSLGNFGFIRIGSTTDVSRRLKDWEQQCKHHIREHKQHALGNGLLVKNAHRVERLVSAELKDVRFQEYSCEGCHRKHQDWYRTTPEHAAKVIKKFSDWMEKDPYQFDQTSNSWRLGEQTRLHDMDMLCRPVAIEPW